MAKKTNSQSGAGSGGEPAMSLFGGAAPPRPAVADDADLLAGLDPAQAAAVRHDAGPLIVLAGPGTGKTRVIIYRTAWAIRRRGVAPESILAVTFTVKAAEELRGRLTKFVGEVVASRVKVHTFNGLGWGIINRFADVLGLPPALTLIDPVQSRHLLRRIILDRSLFPHARGQGIDTLCERLLRRFEDLGNKGLLPERCAEVAGAWRTRVESLPAGPERDAERERAREFEDTARALAAFTAQRQERGWLTYNDQLLLPIRLLRERPHVGLILRQELTSVIVDEFQDCNPAQIEMLRLLVGPGPGVTTDVTIVGDDDQAIYAFRGSDDQAFVRFSKAWPGAAQIELTENHRSGESVIDVANAVIGRAGRRFHPGKTLQRATSSKAVNARVEAVSLAQESNDKEVIVAMLRLAEVRARAAGEGFSWDAFAVIARGHTDLDRISDALRLEGIPFERQVEKNILDEPGIEDVLAWARWLTDPFASSAARRVFTRPPFAVAGERIVELDLAWQGRRSQARAGVVGATEPGAFHEWLAAEHGADPTIGAALHRYAELRVEIAGLRGDESLFRIMTGVDVAHAELLPGRQRAKRISALVALLGVVRDKQPRLEPPGDLHALLAYIDELRELKAFEPQMGLGDVDGDRFEPEGSEEQGRVRLMTAHSAKGLEFDTVFVPRAHGPNGFGTTKERESWVAPPELFDALDDRPPKDRMRDEERRLFYVACTRAERRLVVLGKLGKEPSTALHFFEELTRTNSRPLPIDRCGDADILEQARREGVVVGARSAVSDAGRDAETRTAVTERSDRAATEVRIAAAGALEAVARPGVSGEDVARAGEALRRAASKLAAIAEAGRTGRVPEWHRPVDPEVAAIAARAARDASGDGLARLIRPMTPPLRLSYSMIKDYVRCPRCFYLHEVLGLAEASDEKAGLGRIAHAALQEFFGRVRQAEAEGGVVPGVDDLLRTARAIYFGGIGPEAPVDAAMVDQLEAQLRTCMSRLHDPGANILELEKPIDFPYPLGGHTHRFTAKLDRIEQAADGSFRVVDYKTGKTSKALAEPEPDDLQFGVYAMALRHLYGADLRGSFEYWILSTGERGRIDMGRIDDAKVRTIIDKAVNGMLAGEFSRAAKCEKDCVLLG